MIVELVVNLLVGLVSTIVGLMGKGQPPELLANVGQSVGWLVGYASSMGTWVPWSVVGSAVGAVCGAYVLSLGVKFVRICISLFTGGGGSAA